MTGLELPRSRGPPRDGACRRGDDPHHAAWRDEHSRRAGRFALLEPESCGSPGPAAPDGPGRRLVEDRGSASRPTAVGARTNQLARSVVGTSPTAFSAAADAGDASGPRSHSRRAARTRSPPCRSSAAGPARTPRAFRPRTEKQERRNCRKRPDSSLRGTIARPSFACSARYRRGFESVARFVPRSHSRIVEFSGAIALACPDSAPKP